MVSFPQVFPPDPTCTFCPLVAVCPFYCFLLNSSVQVASGRGGGVQIVKNLVISSLSSSGGAWAITTAVSHPRPHSSTMYVITLPSQVIMCSPYVHKTLLLIDAYEQYHPLFLQCLPVATNLLHFLLNLISDLPLPLHASSVHLTCSLPTQDVRLTRLTLCQEENERDDGALAA